MSADPNYDCLVIGGGISGLGLAHGCRRQGARTRVIEREPEPGGCLRSHPFPGSGGFWTELGTHTCYNTYGHLLEIIRDLDLTGSLVPKAKLPFRLLTDNGVESLFSRLHRWELLRSIPHLLRVSRVGMEVAPYFSRVLGRHNYQDLFGPAFDALICQPADQFPADLLFRRKPRHKAFPRSFTLPQGLSGIPVAIAHQPNLEVTLGRGAVQIARVGDLFQVTLDDGRVLCSRRLGLAIPPDEAARLLAGVYPNLAGLLGQIGMARVESVAVLVPKDKIDLPPLAGIIAPHQAFYSVVSRDYLPDPTYRGFTFHFRPERVPESEQPACIARVLGIPATAIPALARRHNRLPALRIGHQALVEAIDAQLAELPLALAGNYFLGVSLEDCLTRAAAECGRLFSPN